MGGAPYSRAAAAPAPLSRREVLAVAARLLALPLLAALSPGGAGAVPPRRQPGRHPAPRPGATAGRILPDARLADDPAVRLAFAEARQVPQVLDGISCQCACVDDPNSRSLLSCFEGEGMAQHCEVCRGQARLAYRLHRRGRSLADIRAAVDARFGD